jgi:hypothetical protein
MSSDRRGQGLLRRCRFCGLLPAYLGIKCILLKAKIVSLAYLDTRIISLASGCINLLWSLFVFLPFALNGRDPIGFLDRVVWEIPMEAVWPLVLGLGICEVISSVSNSYRGRLVCSLWSMMWWLWLTSMAFLEPPNESAAIMFAVFTFFRSWTFITINHTHPEGKNYGGTTHVVQ